MRALVVALVLCLAGFGGAAMAETLQEMIDAAPDGAEIDISGQVFAGPIVIRRPVVLDGKGTGVIDGHGEGTIVTIESNGVTVFLDLKSAIYVSGSVIDYTTSLMRRGFVIKNPNATSTCSCGDSFGV